MVVLPLPKSCMNCARGKNEQVGGHVQRKRAGAVVKRPIADVLIGAYAMQKGGLITRNEADFRSLYPSLAIFNPDSSSMP